jgi:hypothetical protein
LTLGFWIDRDENRANVGNVFASRSLATETTLELPAWRNYDVLGGVLDVNEIVLMGADYAIGLGELACLPCKSTVHALPVCRIGARQPSACASDVMGEVDDYSVNLKVKSITTILPSTGAKIWGSPQCFGYSFFISTALPDVILRALYLVKRWRAGGLE